MAKGFKDDNGKFHPTENNPIKPIKQDEGMKKLEEQFSKEVSEKRASELKELKGRIKETRVFKFDDLEPDVQEKVLESQRQKTMEFGDNFFSLSVSDSLGSNSNCMKSVPRLLPTSKNFGITFLKTSVPENPVSLSKISPSSSAKKLSKFLGISEILRQKVQFRFLNESTMLGGDSNTKLAFRDEHVGQEIDLDEEYKENPTAFENFAGFPKDKTPTREEYKALQDAVEKWDDLMSNALRRLTSNYESQFTDEALKDDFDANESEFEEDGTPA